MALRRKTILKSLKVVVFIACLLPLAWLIFQVFTGGLGPDPAETMDRYLGIWALRFLLLALAITPLRLLTGIGAFARFRRMIGLFAFVYVTLHLSSFIAIRHVLDLSQVWEDIIKRPFITVGIIAFLLLIPLAATSTSGMIKRLGAKTWKRLHKVVYAAGVLAVFHFFMLVKLSILEPLIYAAILTVLFAVRLWSWGKGRLMRAGTRPGVSRSQPSSQGG